MSEKWTRLSNGDKMAISEAIKIPGFQKGGHYEPNKLDIGFREPQSILLTPRKRKRL